MMHSTENDAPIPFGVRMDTGLPLPSLADEAVEALLVAEKEPTPQMMALNARTEASNVAFAVEGGIDSNDLEQAGWGVLFSPSVTAGIKDALQPLLDHRRAQAQPFVVFEGPTGYRPGDTANEWLKRRGVRMDVVNPDNGVPFYLLLVGPADEMPFEFQYSLDLYWGVGRLWFDTADEFRRYAESVVAYETAATVPTARRCALFATEHDFDEATQLFTRLVAKPLATEEDGSLGRVWQRARYGLQSYLGERATRSSLDAILRGKDGGTPSLLVSGTHGLECPAGHARQNEVQGAVVCQDWSGYGDIKPEHWFAASDLAKDARLNGMLHFFFACYGGGTPEFDNYDRSNGTPRRIAPKPFFSRLPQSMLAHRDGGSLAVVAHIERAWAYSFQGQRRGGQIQGFRDVIGRLLRGERVGQATDMFNMRWAALSTELAEMQADLARGEDVSTSKLGSLWIARDDARNYMVLGDPAVRLRVEDMPDPVAMA